MYNWNSFISCATIFLPNQVSPPLQLQKAISSGWYQGKIVGVHCTKQFVGIMVEKYMNSNRIKKETRWHSVKFKIGTVVLSIALLSQSVNAYGAVLDYETVVENAQKENKTIQTFETEDGSGNTVKVAAQQETLYVTSRTADIYTVPGDNGEVLEELTLGNQVQRNGVCDNGWSKVSYDSSDGKVNGYIQNQMLSEDIQITSVEDEVEVKSDCDILDFPGRKDGEVVGEVIELDQVKRTGTVNGGWSRIEYQASDGSSQEGYIPTSVLNLPEADSASEDTIDKKENAGTVHKSSGEGVFADAIEAGGTVSEENGVQIGTPVAASSDASLKPLGKFKITHYCPCSICCGPWSNGITSTGVIATTNHTIAVDPSQIPYGSKVVINGQVYVAEDCGGAIKTNCIDIYVATHAEGEAKGVYYTDVYLIQ